MDRTTSLAEAKSIEELVEIETEYFDIVRTYGGDPLDRLQLLQIRLEQWLDKEQIFDFDLMSALDRGTLVRRTQRGLDLYIQVARGRCRY